MRKKLKLLILAIACALLYDGCKPTEPEVITTVTVELYDGNTQEPIPNMPFYIQADFGKGNLLYPYYETIDSARTDATGKFTKVFSSTKIGKTYIFFSFPNEKLSEIICWVCLAVNERFGLGHTSF